MPITRQDRIDHWRSLALDALVAASETTDAQARAALVSIAAMYEDLAHRGEGPTLSRTDRTHRGDASDAPD
jgi:hypothetical protein